MVPLLDFHVAKTWVSSYLFEFGADLTFKLMLFFAVNINSMLTCGPVDVV